MAKSLPFHSHQTETPSFAPTVSGEAPTPGNPRIKEDGRLDGNSSLSENSERTAPISRGERSLTEDLEKPQRGCGKTKCHQVVEFL